MTRAHVQLHTGTAAIALLLLASCPAAAAATRTNLPRTWPTKSISKFAEGISDVVMAPDAHAAVGEVANTGLDAFARLYEVNLITGDVIRGSLVFNGGALVVAGTSLGYVEPRFEAVEPNGEAAPVPIARAGELRFLHPGGAEAESAHYLPIDMPDAVAPVSAIASAVWAGATGKVMMISTSTGSVLRSIALPDPEAEFTVSVLGSRLYAIGNAVGVNPIEVYEVSLVTGKIVTSLRVVAVGGSVTAVPTGVWLSYRTGMLGTAELLSSANLKVLSGKPATTSSEAPVPGFYQGMGIQVTVTGETAWLVDAPGAIACVSATTGQVLATSSLTNGDGDLAVIGAIDHRLYVAVGSDRTQGTQIVEVEPPSVCWS